MDILDRYSKDTIDYVLLTDVCKSAILDTIFQMVDRGAPDEEILDDIRQLRARYLSIR